MRPLNGVARHDTCLNHQDNLQALCRKCHARTRPKPTRRDYLLTNGWVAWDLGRGRLGQWYFRGIYLPPPGWWVLMSLPDGWFQGELGEWRLADDRRGATAGT